jgi:membrane protein DedA with SNARE-associated domain
MDSITTWIQGVIASAGYLGIAFVMALENIITPIPSEFVLPFAGFLIARGELNFVVTVVTATIGVVVGGLFWYVLGYKGGLPVAYAITDRWGRIIGIDRAQIDRANEWFKRRGDMIILLGRLIPIFRTLVSIPAGASKMPLPRYLILTIIGSGIWNIVLTGAGVLLGERWEDVLDITDRYETVIYVVVGGALAAFILYRVYRLVQARRAA